MTQVSRSKLTANDIEAMTLPVAASKVGTSRRFLEIQIKKGNLRVVRLSSRCVRIRPTDLAAFLERSAV